MPGSSAPRGLTSSNATGRAAVVLCALLGAVSAWAQESPSSGGSTAAQVPAPVTPAPSAHVEAGHASQGGKASHAVTPVKQGAHASRYHPDRFAGRAGTYYRLIWGVEGLGVKWAESGEVIRFSYRVLDPEKAKTLNEKRNEPSLIDPQAGVQLVVPSMEQIGPLRQSGAPEAGKAYWMTFSNKGRLVKRGDHVSVVIGNFRADGLVVD